MRGSVDMTYFWLVLMFVGVAMTTYGWLTLRERERRR
jgi:hypothetical protein